MKIVVAVDGSELAEAAIAAVAPVARAAQAEVVLVAVRQRGLIHETWAPVGRARDGQAARIPGAEPSSGGHPPMLAIEDRGQAMERARTETDEALRDLAKEYLEGVSCRTHVEWADDIPATIVHIAEAEGADFIALGTHGRTGLKSSLMGSVAQGVLRHTAIPVVFARRSRQ